jgi:hypothetical protein
VGARRVITLAIVLIRVQGLRRGVRVQVQGPDALGSRWFKVLMRGVQLLVRGVQVLTCRVQASPKDPVVICA